MPYKKGSMRGKAFQKSVKAIVRDEIQTELENKVGVIGLTDSNIDTAAIPTGDVAASSNFIKLMPLISQGTGQYNQRMGNEIRLKSLNIKMLFNSVLANASTTALADAGLGVRVMILRQKDQNSQLGVIEDFQGNKLMENGSITAPGPASFDGTTWNLVQKINREQFSVRYDKVFYIDNPFKQGTGGNAVQFPTKTRIMEHTLKFGKQGLKLTFGDGASENPTNFPYIMVVGYASTTALGVPSNNLIRYSYSATANYTDA
mgnify:CR=1 FL=1